ncbi:hypothetical protein [Blastomonas sp.]|uniref:hypothetical protein n=1 Tax=Blastomonas sp. TaxID=1909299 RepID=UPI00391B7E02
MSVREPDFFSIGLEDTTKSQSYEPDPQQVREELNAVLAEAIAARRECPWDASTFKLYKIVFPQMANWLPDNERDQLRFAFAQEIARIEQLMAA